MERVAGSALLSRSERSTLGLHLHEHLLARLARFGIVERTSERGWRGGRNGGLGDRRGGTGPEVVGRLQAFLPGIEMHRGKLTEVRVCNVYVQALRLADERTAISRHIDDYLLRNFPNGLINIF